MNYPCTRQHGQGIKYLRHEDTHEVRAESSKSGLFYQLIKIERKHLKRDAEMTLVDKGIFHSRDVMLVMGIMLVIKHIQNSNLHERLIIVGGLVFDYFDGDQIF